MSDMPGVPALSGIVWVSHKAGEMVDMFDKSVKFDWPYNNPEAPGVSEMTVAGVLTAIAIVSHGKRQFVLLEVEGAAYHVLPDFTVYVAVAY